MRFFLDHDVPVEVTRVLRHEGHEVTELREVLAVRASDVEVFNYAREHGLILIVKLKVSAAGSNVQRTKTTSAARKTANVSKTGAKPIPAIGAKRSLRPKYRYKISSKRKWLTMRSLTLERLQMRYKISSRCNPLWLWDLSP